MSGAELRDRAAVPAVVAPEPCENCPRVLVHIDTIRQDDGAYWAVAPPRGFPAVSVHEVEDATLGWGWYDSTTFDPSPLPVAPRAGRPLGMTWHEHTPERCRAIRAEEGR